MPPTRHQTDHEANLRYNVLFDGVDPALFAEVSRRMPESTFEPGTEIFRDESEGDSLYLIIRGIVKISKSMKSGQEVTLSVLHAGDFFGELELIDGRSRSATALAATGCRIARLEKKDFDRLLRESPEFSVNLLRMLSLRLRSSNILFTHQLQNNLNEAQLQLDKMHRLVEATKSVNSSLEINRLLEIILKTATGAVKADRGTVYLIDAASGELWSKVLQGDEHVEIRLPMGKGIAGFVAATGQTVNIPDAYADPRFNPEIDKASGYRTKTILCMPMRNKEGAIIGVFQLLNKLGGEFSREDEEYLDALSVPASLAVENAAVAQQMVENERLSTVGRMASSIIHDIKNPIGFLRLSAQIIKEKTAKKDIQELSDNMIRQIDRFVAMTQEVLDFSRGQSTVKKEPADCDELFTDWAALVEDDLRKQKITLAQHLGHHGSVLVDREKLTRAFFNIAGNASDAMPKGGTLTVTTRRKQHLLVVEFTDTGVGMPPEVRAKIFQPFFTHGKRHGTGLGLSIVKKIVDDHAGAIEVESAEHKGTTVRMLLPVIP